MLMLMLLVTCGFAVAQRRATVQFHFERADVGVTMYDFRVHEDGSATYSATIADGTQGVEAVTDEKLQLSLGAAGKIFELAKESKRFNVLCASKLRVADTGAKTLTYEGPDGTGSCTFNYSEKKSLDAVANLFLAMEQMLEGGRRLAAAHRYDRLALDAQMSSLVSQMKAGQAAEPGLIVDVLKSLADDPEVFERVRVKAAELLGEARGAR